MAETLEGYKVANVVQLMVVSASMKVYRQMNLTKITQKINKKRSVKYLTDVTHCTSNNFRDTPLTPRTRVEPNII
ncbi:hypothetical protein [Candidatus Parabeggiatoa sp. HSG14]|uniref:hypothetical protein n=1 Tax=Candidatus Parabeggiatoa sp. HSG14 TaxID=3055593 RepID=UPI0025A880C2|nr:hypothetical protein [Thiotrichales bacterium HSG14]